MSVDRIAPPLVDAHCHVDLFPSTAELLATIDRHRVHTIAVTNAPFVFAHTQRLARQTPYLHPALGMHPELVATHGSQLEQLLGLLKDTRFVGEIGLDYVTGDRELRQRQLSIFSRILEECAIQRNKILTIHSRRSARDVIAAIGAEFPCHAILHWFSGSPAEARRALSYGLFFSVNQAMIHSENGRRILAELPPDRVLTETDGPFLKVDGQPQSPPSVAVVLPALAEMWHLELTEARQIIASNFQRLLVDTVSTAANP